jgi:hypothetical protein
LCLRGPTVRRSVRRRLRKHHFLPRAGGGAAARTGCVLRLRPKAFLGSVFLHSFERP